MLIGAMLHNTKLDRYHPIFFRPAPMPGNKDADMAAQRYRSHGHHTDGFETLEEATKYVEEACEKNGWRNSGALYGWDGEDIPAITEFFGPVTEQQDDPGTPTP